MLAALLAGCGDDDAAGADGATGPGLDASAGSDADPSSPWATRADVGEGAVQETAVTAVGGRVFVLGGFDTDAGIVPFVQVYDPATDAWSRGPDLPRPVHHANAAVVDGVIYVVGALEGLSFAPLADVWSWDPNSDALVWASHAPLPRLRGAAVTGVLGGSIVVAGGLAGGAVAWVDTYTPALDQWQARADLPAPRDHACGGVLGDALVVAGGRQAAIASTSAEVWAYSLAGDAWQARPPMPTGRGGAGCGVIDGRLIIVGGEGNPAVATGVFAQAEAYDPVAARWDVLPPMPRPRHGMGAAAIGPTLYVPGGANTDGFGAVAQHDALTPR